MLTTFFDSGQVDAARYRYQPLDFDIGRGWSGLARTILATVALILVMLSVLVVLVARYVIRSRSQQ